MGCTLIVPHAFYASQVIAAVPETRDILIGGFPYPLLAAFHPAAVILFILPLLSHLRL